MKDGKEKNIKKTMPNEVMLTEVTRLIAEGRKVTFMVKGNSMNPFLRNGRDLIVLGPFTEADLLPGAAVLARETGSGRYVFHRIIARDGKQLTLKGDGNLQETEDSTVDDVCGLLVAAVRNGRTYEATGRVWRLYSIWWMRLSWMRRLLLGICHLKNNHKTIML